jgi:hypothetical protein
MKQDNSRKSDNEILESILQNSEYHCSIKICGFIPRKYVYSVSLSLCSSFDFWTHENLPSLPPRRQFVVEHIGIFIQVVCKYSIMYSVLEYE